MQIDAISSINYNNTALALYNLSDSLKRRLVEAGISVYGIKSDEEAEEILQANGISVKEEEKTKKAEKTKAETSKVSYYDEELIFDIKRLASDLGMYVSEDIDMKEMLYNISMVITHLKNLFSNNKNLREVANQFDERYQNIYSRYMARKSTLSTEIIN